MEQDYNQVFKGYLSLPNSGKILLRKSWQQKFCYLYKANKFGIERLEIWDSPDRSKGAPFRIITLENCVKITSDSPTNFTLTTKTAPFTYDFNTTSIELKSKWLSALQSVAFPDDTSLLTSIEDNDLYCSSGEGVFNVKIHPSPASERCGLSSQNIYTLLLTSNSIQLQNSFDGKLLYTWPYLYIRRYGHKNGKFTFEAGRMCESGEGTFFLEHTSQHEIFRCLSLKMSAMKKLIREESTTSSQILNGGDNQLHAALNMEARSRSPLPPSPTTSTTLQDVDSNLSNKTQTLHDQQDQLKPKTAIKPKPAKPPRKLLPTKPTVSVNSTSTKSSLRDIYEPFGKYDHIEYRSDAWRTLGLIDVNHTENNVDEDEEYLSWGGQKITNNVVPVELNKNPKIITETSHLDDNSYDKLNFFGSSSKLNVTSGYKQIALASGNTLPTPPSLNDYDEVQPALEGIRIADDSHLGYALVRKENLKENNINHHFHNNEPYAVISKPKRV